jgi:hypothetical protein
MHAAPTMRRLGAVLGLLAASAAGPTTLAAAEVVAIAGSDGTTAPAWVDIENDTFEQRAHFDAGMRRLSAKLDDQVKSLRAKRAAMTEGVKDWDFAMKEVDASRAYLTSMMHDVSQATTKEAWADAKEKVGEAWRRSQLAVDKLNTTVTS